jgi:hypothetical protein
MNTYSDKHNAEEKPNPLVKEKIIEYTQKNELPCTIAFNIAHELCVSAIEIGKNADLINFRLTKDLHAKMPGISLHYIMSIN